MEAGPPKQRVLILCTANSARSQMAEGLLRWLAGDRFDVASAGSQPGRVHPEAIAAMAGIGVDISRQRSKSVDEFRGQEFDYVLTVCDHARDACPVFAGPARRLHHSFEDPAVAPAQQQAACFGRVRDQLRDFLAGFAQTAASLDA